MANRLTRIYTRTGDNGETGLADGRRVAKDNPQITAIGDIDELNSHLGMILAQDLPSSTRELLIDVQHDLFDIGAELALSDVIRLTASHVEYLENLLDMMNSSLPPLKEFILPSGGLAAAACHVARAVCRRAERALVGLNRTQTLNPYTLQYVNRLSDTLFVLARVCARESDQAEIYWNPTRRHPGAHSV